jgi:osmoprotectant transport system substrate-binding protein
MNRWLVAAVVVVLAASGCGGMTGKHRARSTRSDTGTAATTTPLPGADRPPVTIGDKNFTEQFILGELYRRALSAQGYHVSSTRNIGPTDVSFQALTDGTLTMYPEYLNVWNATVAKGTQTFTSTGGAYRAGEAFARAHGMRLLSPTPFSDTEGIGVTTAFAQANHLHAIGDLAQVASTLALGAPLEFTRSRAGLSDVEQAYGFTPAAVKPLDIGAQYEALYRGTVQAAYVSTTDGMLTDPGYTLLRDPVGVFGVGNVVPVVSAKALAAEGPVFRATINAVSRLLSLGVIRRLNALVDVYHEDPGKVAKQFLEAHGLVVGTSG